ncbi:porin [Kaarinaea lacus]
MKMKHSLIAVIGGVASIAMVAPAMADVTAYGLAQVEITSYSNNQEATGCTDQDAASGEGGCDGLKVQDRANGRVGLKASEDLGNGWTGLAKAEFQVDYANGGWATSPTNAAREAFVGLKGSGVEIQLGNLKSAYKYTGGVKYDPFVATSLESRRDNGGMRHGAFGQGGFLARSIGVMGKAGAIKYWVTYAPGEADHYMTASVMFSQDAFEVFVAVSDEGDIDTAPESNTKFGGAYKMGATKIKLQYEMVDRDLTPSRDETYTFLGVEHKIGKNTIVAQIGMYDADQTGSPTADTDYMALGVIHKFTKQTRLWAGLRTSDADNKTDEDTISVGLRKDF